MLDEEELKEQWGEYLPLIDWDFQHVKEHLMDYTLEEIISDKSEILEELEWYYRNGYITVEQLKTYRKRYEDLTEMRKRAGPADEPRLLTPVNGPKTIFEQTLLDVKRLINLPAFKNTQKVVQSIPPKEKSDVFINDRKKPNSSKKDETDS